MRTMRHVAFGIGALLALAACGPEVPLSNAPEVEAPYRGEGISAPEAEAIAASIFAANGCEMSINDYIKKLDEAGYDPDLIDITTPAGHRRALDRVILEATPMDASSGDKFTRSGSRLTSHIGDCA